MIRHGFSGRDVEGRTSEVFLSVDEIPRKGDHVEHPLLGDRRVAFVAWRVNRELGIDRLMPTVWLEPERAT